MLNLRFVLLLIAFILLLLAGLGVQSRFNLTALGLAVWVLALIVTVP